ncbi:MAG TPA: signal peptidase II [Bryobacteraceae bacterium]|nr:signal peptidase II [Bryobacteraceae bacterium]
MPERRLLPYGLAVAVFVIDRITKSIIEHHVSFSDTFTVIPGFFDIVHSQNRGVAFGLFHDSTSPWHSLLLVGFSLVALGVIGGMLWRPSKLDRSTRIGLALILGGAAGNVFDRVVAGKVTDFLELYLGDFHWPTFNLADTAIVIGSGLLLIDLLRPKRQPART